MFFSQVITYSYITPDDNVSTHLDVGNPLYDEVPKEQIRIEVLKRLPQITKIDGDLVKPAERELATGVKIEWTKPTTILYLYIKSYQL